MDLQNNFICLKCKHFLSDKNGVNISCKAFINGIPNEILLGENNHLYPLKNQDNKIVFSKK